jgi:tight adherence protein C
MLIPMIAACCAATFFAVTVAFLGFRSDASRLVAELDWASRNKPGQERSGVVRRILSGVDKTAVGAKLAEAGWYQTSVKSFVMSRFIAAGVGAAAGGLVSIVFKQPAFFFLGITVLGVVGLVIPSFIIDSAIKKRKQAIAKRIPDLLDMVSTTVEAGTALNSALATATQSFDGPLAEEIAIVLSDVRLGRSRADAFNAMGQRAKQSDLSSLVTAIVQTERLGGNIGDVLDELAQEARAARLSRAEAIAARLPVLMILPMAFFMLPALFVMIFTPVISNMLRMK